MPRIFPERANRTPVGSVTARKNITYENKQRIRRKLNIIPNFFQCVHDFVRRFLKPFCNFWEKVGLDIEYTGTQCRVLAI
jgi:lysyl-tRNA synthetase class I